MRVLDNEKLVISFLFTSDEITQRSIVSQLQVERLVYSETRIVYDACAQMIRESKRLEVPLVANYLGSDNLASIGGLEYLQSLVRFKDVMGHQTPIHSWDEYVKLVDKAGKLYKLGEIFVKYKNLFTDLDTLLQNVDSVEGFYKTINNELTKIRAGASDTPKHISHAAEKELKRIKKVQETGESDILQCNFPSLYQHGFPYAPSFGMILGMSSSGKSQSAFSLTLGAAQNFKNDNDIALIYSLETEDSIILSRLACMIAMVDSIKIRTNSLSNAEWERYYKAIGYLSELPIYIRDNPIYTDDQIYNDMLGVALTYNIKIAVFDYSELIRVNGKVESEELRVSTVGQTLKAATYMVGACGMLLSQVTDFNNSASKIAGAEGARRSKSLSHMMDWVFETWCYQLFVKKNMNVNVPDELDKHHLWLIFSKYKQGRIGLKIALKWIDTYTRIEDPEWNNQFNMMGVFSKNGKHPEPQLQNIPQVDCVY